MTGPVDKVHLLDVIQRIFISYGFEVQTRSEDRRYLLMKKDDTLLSVGFWSKNESISKKEFITFMGQASTDDAHRSIFISTADFSGEINGLAKEGDVQLWNKDRFEKELGRVILSEVEDTSMDRTKAFTEFFADLEGKKLSYRDRGFIVSSSEVVGEIPRAKVEVEENPDRCGDGGDEEEEEKPGPDSDAPILKPTITRERAEEISSRMGNDVRLDMELVPHHLFDYYCETTVEGRLEPEAHTGHLAVNGFTQTIEEWDPEREVVEELGDEYTRLESKMSSKDAVDSIMDAIINEYTTTIETVEEKDSATVIEKKKVRPKEDAIEIQDKGIVYLPVWCAEGSKGVMLVDATTGNVIREDPFKK